MYCVMYDAGKALILKLKMREKKEETFIFFFMYVPTYLRRK